jgi:hypothetical protein
MTKKFQENFPEVNNLPLGTTKVKDSSRIEVYRDVLLTPEPVRPNWKHGLMLLYFMLIILMFKAIN